MMVITEPTRRNSLIEFVLSGLIFLILFLKIL